MRAALFLIVVAVGVVSVPDAAEARVLGRRGARLGDAIGEGIGDALSQSFSATLDALLDPFGAMERHAAESESAPVGEAGGAVEISPAPGGQQQVRTPVFRRAGRTGRLFGRRR